jgi:hypothetical protein
VQDINKTKKKLRITHQQAKLFEATN